MIIIKTIKDNVTNTIIIKNSKFICLLYKIHSIKDITKYLSEAKNNYKNATHYCYGYILDNDIKSNDDKEPNNTAGVPIVKVLEQNNLNHVLCIVVRYFGGIKLGVGALTRAYSKSVSQGLKLTTFTNLIKCQNITITFSYSQEKVINNIIKNDIINNKTYLDNITYNITVINCNTINNLKQIDIFIKYNNYQYIEKELV
ncbi:MAG: YigZ family protein [bacterium]|nr:YigZ family protein [bacterium]